MYLRENVINNVKREQKMTDLLAFSEFWRRLSHLGKFNTCQWHSACTKFGHSNIFATLSYIYALARPIRTLSLERTASPPLLLILYFIRARVCKYTALPLAKLLMLGNVQASLHCARLLAALADVVAITLPTTRNAKISAETAGMFGKCCIFAVRNQLT